MLQFFTAIGVAAMQPSVRVALAQHLPLLARKALEFMELSQVRLMVPFVAPSLPFRSLFCFFLFS